ncbi:MAG: TonB-dependent receptor [Candidatus Aminicenantes bacterium]|nr:TonB-dependent receptor [Candidatus Aminicenantes bacterium]
MKYGRFSVFLIFVLGLVGLLYPQAMQTGALRGTVKDDSGGAPLPGVNLTVAGPALMRTAAAVTNEEGVFRFPGLPPGRDYTLTAELQGFQPVKREGIIISVGMTVTVALQMKLSALTAELTVVAPSPTVDVVQSKTVQTITAHIMQRLPLARNVIGAMQIAPAVSGRSIHGTGSADHGASIDGIQANEPDQNQMITSPSWDIIEEVEMITTGASAEFFNAIGGFINIVTKSGGNKFSGQAQAYYTSKGLTQILLADEQLKTLGISKPSAPVSDLDMSLSLGGPIVKDKIWFMTSFKYMPSSISGDFRPTTILGKSYDTFDREYSPMQAFGKLSFLLSSNIRLSIMGQYEYANTPLYYTGWNRTWEASKNNIEKRANYSANVSWTVDPNTLVDARFGGLNFQWEGRYPEGVRADSPHYIDGYTSYIWGSSNLAEFTFKEILFGSLRLTRFQDNFLGGDHEFKAGVEIQKNTGDWGFHRPNPMYWNYYNGNPYYYRGLYGLNSAHPTYGDGQLTFYAIGPNLRDSFRRGVVNRLGFFVQDSWTIKNRLTLNIGARFDTMTSHTPELTKKAAGTPLALAIGETYFVPAYGFNPYAALTYPRWDDPFPYSFFGPIVGLTYDLFGDAKTALKASWARQAEGLPTGVFSGQHPIGARGYSFYWWDQNGNGAPDLPGVDRYQHFGSSPLAMLSTAYLDAIDPEVKIPYNDEIMIGVEHELFRNFRIGARYIYKDRKNLMAAIYYDRTTAKYWNTYEAAPQYWVPFTTTIPASGDFPARTVTMYFMSNTAPATFTRISNVPEAKMKYQNVELTFDKRMSGGWQLGGSVTISELLGNYPLTVGSMYTFGTFQQPNYSINQYGRMPLDRPLMIKLYGTFTLPYRLLASFFYRHQSGTPWTRTVTVVPPSAWAAANNTNTLSWTINVDPSGTYRLKSSDNVDFRLEKEFPVMGIGTLGLFADVFNLFGYTELYTTSNPGGTWRPDDANTTAGTFAAAWTGITGHTGQRVFKFSVRFAF